VYISTTSSGPTGTSVSRNAVDRQTPAEKLDEFSKRRFDALAV